MVEVMQDTVVSCAMGDGPCVHNSVLKGPKALKALLSCETFCSVPISSWKSYIWKARKKIQLLMQYTIPVLGEELYRKLMFWYSLPWEYNLPASISVASRLWNLARTALHCNESIQFATSVESSLSRGPNLWICFWKRVTCCISHMVFWRDSAEPSRGPSIHPSRDFLLQSYPQATAS